MQVLSFSPTRGSLVVEKNSLSAGSGNCSVGPFSPGQWRAYIYVFLVILISVKNCREHATIHLLHFSISRDGFGSGMKTFFPDSSTSLRDLVHFSRYLESVLHSARQQCLVLTILRRFRGQTSHFKRFSRRFPAKKISEHPYISFIDMQCLSESRGRSDLTLSIFRTCVQRYWVALRIQLSRKFLYT